MPNLKKLKNGVTVLTDYVSSVETVCVGMWVYAVSYTHLTLPTICSV